MKIILVKHRRKANKILLKKWYLGLPKSIKIIYRKTQYNKYASFVNSCNPKLRPYGQLIKLLVFFFLFFLDTALLYWCY